MVDWGLARQIAALAAGRGTEEEPPFDAAALSVEMEPAVAGLHPPRARLAHAAGGGREPGRVGVGEPRRRWSTSSTRWRSASTSDLSFAGPLAGALRVGASATLAAEAGLVMGYLSSRVLGQYDVSLLGAETDPRLLFVGPNLAGAVRDLDVDADAFGRWICAHELTHVFQFQGVPWLREHMAGLLRRYVETLEVRIEKGSAGGLPSLPDPQKLVSAFREGGLAALVQSPEQRALMDEVQAAMSVIEGYSEHVMDARGGRVHPRPREAARGDGPAPRVAAPRRSGSSSGCSGST